MGDAAASIAHYCLHRLGWEPKRVLALTREELAFVTASIRLYNERSGG